MDREEDSGERNRMTPSDVKEIVNEINRLITIEARVKGETSMIHQPIRLVQAYEALVNLSRETEDAQ